MLGEPILRMALPSFSHLMALLFLYSSMAIVSKSRMTYKEWARIGGQYFNCLLVVSIVAVTLRHVVAITNIFWQIGSVLGEVEGKSPQERGEGHCVRDMARVF